MATIRRSASLLGALVLASGAVSATASATASRQPPAHTSAAVGQLVRTAHDASGRVTVSVFSRHGSPPQQHWNDETVLVGDPDMVAVGGGGTAAEGPVGALLTASYPNADLTGWSVSSKDHIHPQAHELDTYVIGLKIAGLSRARLRDAVLVTPADSGTAPHPEAEAGIPSDSYVLLGGGFKIDYTGYGSLATASFPSSASTWKARAKDHEVSDPARVRAFAIGLRRDLPVGRVIPVITSAESSQAPHPAAVATLTPGYALTGGGADVHYTGAGNLLWKLRPDTEPSATFSAASKDHDISDPAHLTAYATGIRID